jgi:glycosyltransferase involved in cell wall biosynthesis
MRVFLFGYPGALGGANTEAWHTIRLWKEGGIDVHVVPTWGRDRPWKRRLAAAGVPTHEVSQRELASTPQLPGSVCVSFCNARFLEIAPQLRTLGCPLVWVNCMTWIFPQERLLYDRHGLCDAMVFQSEFQRSLLEPELRPFGYAPSQGWLIRGAFYWDEWPFRLPPRRPDGMFRVGRLARPDPDKWPADLWQIYASIAHRPLEARVMGWNDRIAWKCGPPPAWAETLAPLQEDAGAFLRSLDGLVTANGGARENWPRIGLEAMASGVPVVAENRWGWREMIAHGETGLLADTPQELARYATWLAHDVALRRQLAIAARARLERELAHPDTLRRSWQRLFDQLLRGRVA